MMVEVVSRKSLTLAALANPEGWWGKSGRERQGGGRVWSLFSIGAQRPNDERNTDNYERKPATAELKFGSRLLYRRGHEIRCVYNRLFSARFGWIIDVNEKRECIWDIYACSARLYCTEYAATYPSQP